MKENNMYELAIERRNELVKIRNNALLHLENAPKGKLYIRRREGVTQYYLRMDVQEKCGTYLSKKEVKTIKNYVQKDYYARLLKLTEQEVKAIDRMISDVGIEIAGQSTINTNRLNKKLASRNATDNQLLLAQVNTPITAIRNLYSSYPDQAKKYINPIDMSDEDYINSWLEMERNYKPVGNRTADYVTQNNELVRSKSEINIANALKKNGIPYKYEAELKLKGGAVIYPDFTILDVKNRREVYWEHRGMMDDREYCRDSVRRIKLYANNNLFPGDGLILSEETSATPLGTTDINDLIRHYL